MIAPPFLSSHWVALVNVATINDGDPFGTTIVAGVTLLKCPHTCTGEMLGDAPPIERARRFRLGDVPGGTGQVLRELFAEALDESEAAMRREIAARSV